MVPASSVDRPLLGRQVAMRQAKERPVAVGRQLDLDRGRARWDDRAQIIQRLKGYAETGRQQPFFDF